RPYPKTVQQRKIIQQEVQQMINNNQVGPSRSPWSSPVIIQEKKDGTIRFLVDYRKLNAVTKKDNYPHPSTEELLNRIGGHQYYTKLDLKSGYFQIPISKADRPKTAFITQDGLYEFYVLSQGLMNAPATFQRVMNDLIGNGRWDYVVVYLDDILIFSNSFEEHQQHLNEILGILATANFQVNSAKCTIAVPEIEFLSHIISKNQLKPSSDKIKPIIDMIEPTTLKQANAFIGKLNWYRKFIPNFARIAAPINKVTNKTKAKRNEFKWGPEQSKSFHQFKQILISKPLFLDYPDPTAPFILTTDASNHQVGGILRQETKEGVRINYYVSIMMSEAERKYHPTEREFLGIYWCLNKLRNYIGSSSIIVETDHKPLINFHHGLKFKNQRIENWLLKLQDLLPQVIDVKYILGKNNSAADYLSRRQTPANSNTENRANGDWIQQPESWSETEPRAHQFIPSAPNITHQPPSKNNSWKKIQTLLFFLLVRKLFKSTSQKNQAKETATEVLLNPVTTRSTSKALGSLPPQAVPNIPTPQLQSASPSALLDLSEEKIRSEQLQDNIIQEKIARCNLTTKTNYKMINGILHRTNLSSCSTPLPYLPQTMIQAVLFANHDHPLSGHFGIERTYNKLKDKYYWPKMFETIQNYVQSCPECSQYNIQRRKPPGHLKPIRPPNEVFQVLGMDWWGPTQQESSDGNRYVLVITDLLSKYVIAKAFPANNALTTATMFMEEFILNHGAPECLITDQGSHFNNELMQAITKMIDTKHVFSTAYHPQTNGQVERFNATFCQQLSKYCHHNSEDWDHYLKYVVYAYNNTKHSSTKFTPYELAFNRQSRFPFDPPKTAFKFTKPNDYWTQVNTYKKLVHSIVQANIKQQQHLAKKRRRKIIQVRSTIHWTFCHPQTIESAQLPGGTSTRWLSTDRASQQHDSCIRTKYLVNIMKTITC
ncbi:unnamed protein product, partial [Didymodactylos carnosus]